MKIPNYKDVFVTQIYLYESFQNNYNYDYIIFLNTYLRKKTNYNIINNIKIYKYKNNIIKDIFYINSKLKLITYDKDNGIIYHNQIYFDSITLQQRLRFVYYTIRFTDSPLSIRIA